MKAFLKFLKSLFTRIFGVHSKSFDCKLDVDKDGRYDIEVKVIDGNNVIEENKIIKED